MYKLIRHVYLPRLRRWWALNPSVTRFLPRWANKRLQFIGERLRSHYAQQESETVTLPFPYNEGVYLEAYCFNRKSAEPDFEPYWQEQQRLINLQNLYRKAKLLRGYTCELTLIP